MTIPKKIAWTNYRDYFKVVMDNYTRIQDLKREIDQIRSHLEGKTLSDEDINLLRSKNATISQLSLIVIIFSAFTLEAYINDYGIKRLTQDCFSKYLDRLNLISKWHVIPRMITAKKMDDSSEAMQDLVWFDGLRTRMAYFKSETAPVQGKSIENIKESESLGYEDSVKAIRTVRGVVSLLKKIDPTAETDWLDQSI